MAALKFFKVLALPAPGSLVADGLYFVLEGVNFTIYLTDSSAVAHPIAAGVVYATGVLFGHGNPGALLGVDGNDYLDLDTLNWWNKVAGTWHALSSTLLAVQNTLPALAATQRGFALLTGQYADPDIVDAYMSDGT